MTEPGDLAPQEAQALRALRRDASSTAELEERVVDRLRREGLVGRRRSGRTLAWAAVLAGVFLAGVAVGDRWLGAPAAVEQTRYVLLLREGPSYRAASTPDARRARVAEYGAWARTLAGDGRFVEGEKLAGEERFVAFPAAGTEDRTGAIAGYFVIESTSYEEAVRIARDSPHVRHGGVVEVRKIEDTGT
ncbi:MAG: YciI family protein [Gemmatimonadota bacterium]